MSCRNISGHVCVEAEGAVPINDPTNTSTDHSIKWNVSKSKDHVLQNFPKLSDPVTKRTDCDTCNSFVSQSSFITSKWISLRALYDALLPKHNITPVHSSTTKLRCYTSHGMSTCYDESSTSTMKFIQISCNGWLHVEAFDIKM